MVKGEAAVAGGVEGDGTVVDGDLEGEVVVFDAPVTGVLPRAALPLLAVLDVDHVEHFDPHPDGGAGFGHDPCRRLIDCDLRLHLAAE